LAAGTVFSLLLIVAFSPAAWIMRAQDEEINKELNAAAAKPFDWSAIYIDTAKIAGPFLAALPLASLFKG
jgi:hypothetical protein